MGRLLEIRMLEVQCNSKVFFCLDCLPYEGIVEGIYILQGPAPVPTLQVDSIFVKLKLGQTRILKSIHQYFHCCHCSSCRTALAKH